MKALFLILAGLIISGCSSAIQTATQYYQFEQPITDSSRNVQDTKAQLRVQTVTLRGALNNRGIAMKVDNNQVHAANYHLWGESPDVMLTTTAQQTLFNAMSNWMVIKGLPVITDQQQQIFYELEYELHHFNGDLQGNADISGLWRLYYTHPESGRRLLSIHNFSNVKPIDDDGYDSLVATLEKMWLEINSNVANTIEKTRLNHK